MWCVAEGVDEGRGRGATGAGDLLPIAYLLITVRLLGTGSDIMNPLIIPQLAVHDTKATPLAQSGKSRGLFSRH